MGGLVLTPHIVYRGFDGEDAVDVNQPILEHIGRRHVDGAGIGTEAERGSSESEACAEAEESDGSPNQPMMCATFLRISSLGDPFLL